MREKIYNFIAGLVIKRNRTVILIISLVTLVSLILSFRLGIKNQLADMMPQDIPQVESFNSIIQDFTSDAVVMVAVDSPEKDEKRMIEAAEYIADNISFVQNIKPFPDQDLGIIQRLKIFRGEFPVEGVRYDTLNYIKRIDLKLDTEFALRHGGIIQKNQDLKNFTEMFKDAGFAEILQNINGVFESEYIGDADRLNSIDKEAKAIAGLHNIFSFADSFGRYIDTKDTVEARDSVKRLVIGDEYFFSPDRSMLLVEITPNVSTDDFDNIIIMSREISRRIEKISEIYPDLQFSIAGTPVLAQQEQDAVLNDAWSSTMIALIIVAFIMIASFRSWRNPLSSIITLSASLVISAGVLTLTLGDLNTMSAAFGVMLVGLGIDYAIHFLTGYKDARDHGENCEQAVHTMYLKVGNGVLTGAITTSAVFFILVTIGFRAFSDMGFAMGISIILAAILMFVLFPALLVSSERKSGRLQLKRLEKVFNNRIFVRIGDLMQFRFMEKIGSLSKNRLYIVSVIVISVIITFFSLYGMYNIKYEYDLTKLEPEGLPAIDAQNMIIEKYGISPDFAMFLSRDVDSVRHKVEKLKELADRTELIGRIDAVTEYFAPEEEQNKNKSVLIDFRNEMGAFSPGSYSSGTSEKILYELHRLHDNIVEIGEIAVVNSGENNKLTVKADEIAGRRDEDSRILKIMSKFEKTNDKETVVMGFQEAYVTELRNVLMQITDTAFVTFENIPENIRSRYMNEKTGSMLVSVYPSSNIWEENNLRNFLDRTGEIDKNITGMPVLTMIFVDLIKTKGKEAVLWGLLIIVVLLLIDFRSVRYTAIAVIPLVLGLIWMLGIMYLFNMKLNINNFMAMPIIIGIGIDDGVHMLHRYLIEGRHSIDKVTRFTGKAVLLTSLTTVIGFGSIAFSDHRGLASMGTVLAIGVMTCFITSAFLLPAIISLKDKIKYGDRL
jgi:uncharacterized protein